MTCLLPSNIFSNAADKAVVGTDDEWENVSDWLAVNR